MKGNMMSGDEKGAGGGEDGSMGNVRDKNNGVRGGKGAKGVGIGETCSGAMEDSVTASGNNKDCVASSCDTEKVTSEGRGEAFSSKMSLLVIVTFISLRLVRGIAEVAVG